MTNVSKRARDIVKISLQKTTHSFKNSQRVNSGQLVLFTQCGYSITTLKRRYRSNVYPIRKNFLSVASIREPTCPLCIKTDNKWVRIPRYIKYVAYRTLDRIRILSKQVFNKILG